MKIVGGTYIEQCVVPQTEALLGSGGRAALALRSLIDVQFETFFPDPEEVRVNFGNATTTHRTAGALTFRYLHPLAKPELLGIVPSKPNAVKVVGETVLRFGCVEGSFSVDADQVVYDPQGEAPSYRANGSQARRLGIVLNGNELASRTGHNAPLEDNARNLLRSEGAEVVIVKLGVTGGLVVTEKGAVEQFPAFKTKRVGKIGSGDIFSATFAYHWMVRRLPCYEAALLASRQTADYVETNVIERPAEPPFAEPISCDPSEITVLIASDLRTMADRWVAFEAKQALSRLGASHVHVIEKYEANQLTSLIDRYDTVLVIPSTEHGLASRAITAVTQAGSAGVLFCDDRSLRASIEAGDLPIYGDFAASLYNVLWSANEGAALFRRD